MTKAKMFSSKEYSKISFKPRGVFRSSRSQMFFKIGVLKNLAIFTGKHMCWSLFLIRAWHESLQRYYKRLFPLTTLASTIHWRLLTVLNKATKVYCRFSYTKAWKLLNLSVGTKIFRYHISASTKHYASKED